MPNPESPSPDRFLRTVNAYRESATLKGGIDLDVFTAIGGGVTTAADLARLRGTSAKGMRILCDCLTTLGFLEKDAGSYALTPDSAVFLDRRSADYLGDAVYFLLGPLFTANIGDVAAAVRKGGVVSSARGSDEAGHPEWVAFARAMTGMQRLPARRVAERFALPQDRSVKILEIAAGSGIFGVTLAARYANVRITAVDWPNVLEVARENAVAAGVAGQIEYRPGDAFAIDFGREFDIALIVNFLHHFDAPTCTALIRRVGAALHADGCIVAVDFVPDEDRTSPPAAAMFALQMLRQTPDGDAYTAGDYRSMFNAAGFTDLQFEPMPPTAYTWISAKR
jgi:ubiquinone/menaquinone biosynthesis C-methylase UbiE